MMDNLIIPRQFVVDLRAAKIQQLRALQNEISQYDRWLKLPPGNQQDTASTNGVAFPSEPPAPLGDESEWS